jgi:hypothetical protein
MTTNSPGSLARQDPRQVSNTMRGSITFSSGGGVTAVFVPLGVIPKGAWVISAQLSIDTAFNAGTTNTVDFGTSGAPTQFIAAQAGATPGNFAAAASTLGKAAAAAADAVIGLRYNFTGTAPSTGAAEFMIEYEGGFPGQAGVDFSG